MTTTETTDKITQRIVELFHPLRVILFGSRARGDARIDSDFDLLIIAPSDKPRWQRTVPVYRALAGMGVPKDIVWWTPEEIEEWSSVKSHFINTVLREGKVLYENSN
ncbi:MAG: nucleotidyltransferase domain-containing protein [candidate division KSB1 bacterium]|nr:nucleotidyltransferase domain-containing protein [candidate division KSB1 bacterium]MDZ7303332.1 nucleotidyltransferase domain-containing protein [candidate division KSB1 bacterium]MDZ7310418.1 nucleotidyltransferase domain-containing protein [candidate division KSB1 bacterium]